MHRLDFGLLIAFTYVYACLLSSHTLVPDYWLRIKYAELCYATSGMKRAKGTDVGEIKGGMMGDRGVKYKREYLFVWKR